LQSSGQSHGVVLWIVIYCFRLQGIFWFGDGGNAKAKTTMIIMLVVVMMMMMMMMMMIIIIIIIIIIILSLEVFCSLLKLNAVGI
jgi:hypothetical protein